MPENNAVDYTPFLRFFLAYRKEPDTWADFAALHVELKEEITLKLSSLEIVFSSYLQNIPHKIYITGAKDLFILYRDKDTNHIYDALEELQLCYFKDEASLAIQWYCLKNQIEEFSTHIINHIVPLCNLAFADIYDSSLQKSYEGESKKKKNCRVLLIEDDLVVRWMIRRLLKGKCEFATASCIHQIYSLYTGWRPDLVFLDIGLPDGSGEEALEWIMAHDPAANVIMFSSQDDIDTMVSMMEQGARGFINKPFQRQRVLHYLEEYATV